MRPALLSLAALALACTQAEPPVRDGLQAAGGGEGGGDPGPPRIALHRVAAFVQPTDVRFVPGSRAMIVTQATGDLVVHDRDSGDRLVLAHLDVSADGEDLLSLALHPSFATNGRLFVQGTFDAPQGSIRVIELDVDPSDLDAGVAAQRTVLDVPVELGAHAGGQLRFGPDGMLYVSIGDGGAYMRRDGTGQDPADLFGKILRLDVDHQDPGLGYAIPPDNPFAGSSSPRPEIFAMGMRNPWRMTFAGDRLVVGDVGEKGAEEVNLVEAGDDLGWRTMEGDACFPSSAPCDPSLYVAPYFTYPTGPGASISGGAIAGAALPALEGRFVFGDWVTGELRAIDLGGDPAPLDLGPTGKHVSSVNRDEAGALYVVDYGDGGPDGGVYRVDPAP